MCGWRDSLAEDKVLCADATSNLATPLQCDKLKILSAIVAFPLRSRGSTTKLVLCGSGCLQGAFGRASLMYTGFVICAMWVNSPICGNFDSCTWHSAVVAPKIRICSGRITKKYHQIGIRCAGAYQFLG